MDEGAVPLDSLWGAESGGGGGASLSADALGLTTAEQLLGSAAEQMEPESEDEYEPMPLKSRRVEKKRLGKAGPRDTCYFCAFKGERDTVPIYNAQMEALIEFMRTNFGRMNTPLLAEQLAAQYEKIRAERNASLAPGQLPLPPMSESTIIAHMRTHIQDIQWKQIVMLEALQEAREELTGMLFERARKSKRKRPNRNAFQCLDTTIKLELTVQGRDVSKMSHYEADARVSTAARSGGPISTENKQIYDFWRKQKRAQ